MPFNSRLSADYIRDMVLRDFRAFDEVVTKRVLPTFDNFGTEALEHGDEWFQERAGHLNPLDDDEYDAAAYYADQAMDKTLAFADMLVSMYFASSALYTVGLFHLFEQHAADFLLWLLGCGSDKEVRLKDFTGWLKSDASIEVEALGSWATIQELRLVANAIKHAEGTSAAKLRKTRPELFVHPSARDGDKRGHRVKRRIRKPLFGEDLYLTSDDFSRYSRAVMGFWEELANLMKAVA